MRDERVEDSPDYTRWPIESEDDHRYLGMRKAPMLYSPGDHRILEAEIDVDNRRLIPKEEESWDVEPEETLGDALERLGEELDWDSLSSFAREHFEDEE